MKIARVKFSDSGKTFEKGQVVNLPEERLKKIARLLEDSETEKKEFKPEVEKNEIVMSTEKVKRKRKNE
jgi:hypothetical protein